MPLQQTEGDRLKIPRQIALNDCHQLFPENRQKVFRVLELKRQAVVYHRDAFTGESIRTALEASGKSGIPPGIGQQLPLNT